MDLGINTNLASRSQAVDEFDPIFSSLGWRAVCGATSVHVEYASQDPEPDSATTHDHCFSLPDGDISRSQPVQIAHSRASTIPPALVIFTTDLTSALTLVLQSSMSHFLRRNCMSWYIKRATSSQQEYRPGKTCDLLMSHRCWRM